AGTLDEAVWPDLFMDVVRPLIPICETSGGTPPRSTELVAALDGEIALADVFALEAIRVFLPDVFARLTGAVDGLTRTSGMHGGGRQERPELKARVDALLDAAGSQRDIVRAMIERLFPSARRHIGGSHYGPDWKPRWLRERRVAHEDILRLYLERVAGEGLQAFQDAEQAWSRMADRNALNTYLRSLDRARLEDVVSALEV